MSSPIDDLIDWFPKDVQYRVTGMYYTPDDVMIEADKYIGTLHDKINRLHSNKVVRVDNFTKKVLEAASKEFNLSQASIVSDLVLNKFQTIANKERLK